MVFVRTGGANGDLSHQGAFPADGSLVSGFLLPYQSKDGTSLMIEIVASRTGQWLLLEQVLLAESRTTAEGTVNLQTIKVLDARPLPAAAQVIGSSGGVAACEWKGARDAEVVAIRKRLPDEPYRPWFTEFMEVLRVNPSSLRFETINPTGTRCANPFPGEVDP